MTDCDPVEAAEVSGGPGVQSNAKRLHPLSKNPLFVQGSQNALFSGLWVLDNSMSQNFSFCYG